MSLSAIGKNENTLLVWLCRIYDHSGRIVFSIVLQHMECRTLRQIAVPLEPMIKM